MVNLTIYPTQGGRVYPTYIIIFMNFGGSYQGVTPFWRGGTIFSPYTPPWGGVSNIYLLKNKNKKYLYSPYHRPVVDGIPHHHIGIYPLYIPIFPSLYPLCVLTTHSVCGKYTIYYKF